MTQLNLSGNQSTHTQRNPAAKPDGGSIKNQTVGALGALAMFAAVIVIGSCSRSDKPVAVQQPAQTAALVSGPAATLPSPAPAPVEAKVKKHLASTRSYVNRDFGISFTFPRKYQLKTGNAAQASDRTAWAEGTNFVRPGGTTLAAVLMPENAYPGTDFEAGLINLSVEPGMTSNECSQFAVPEAVPEVVKAGGNEFTKLAPTTDSTTIEESQAEYYHAFRNGTCYEFALAVASGGDKAKAGNAKVERSEVFSKLEKILASVKLPAPTPVSDEPAANTAVTPSGSAEGETRQNF
jgi:hypothetical protein